VTGKTWAHWFFRIGAFRSSFLAVFRLFTGKIWVFLPIGGLLSCWPLGQLFFLMFPVYIQIYRRTEIHHIHDIYIYIHMKDTW
jgi:hypothetical protein